MYRYLAGCFGLISCRHYLGNEAVLSRSMEAATILVSIGPIVLIYPFFQKYFVKGVMVGSLKG